MDEVAVYVPVRNNDEVIDISTDDEAVAAPDAKPLVLFDAAAVAKRDGDDAAAAKRDAKRDAAAKHAAARREHEEYWRQRVRNTKIRSPKLGGDELFDQHSFFPNSVALSPAQRAFLNRLAAKHSLRVPFYVCTIKESSTIKFKGKMVNS